jgi:hypothetical protein
VRFLVVGVVGVGALLAACSNDRPSSPRIDELAPPTATAGQVVNILGLAFCGQDPKDLGAGGTCAKTLDGFVTFSTEPGISRADSTVTAWDDTQISVRLPGELTGVADVVVTVGGRASNAVPISIR